MRITDQVLGGLLALKRFHEHFQDRVNSLDYSANGELLLLAADDDSLHLFDSLQGVYAFCT